MLSAASVLVSRLAFKSHIGGTVGLTSCFSIGVKSINKKETERREVAPLQAEFNNSLTCLVLFSFFRLILLYLLLLQAALQRGPTA